MLPREFALESHFAKWEFAARYHFTASDVETMSVAELLRMADPGDERRWYDARLGYIETQGTEEARSAIAGTYASVEPDDVLAFAGAEEGLYCAVHAILEPGDHAIVVVPNYQSLESVPLTICDVSGIGLRAARGWSIDIEEFQSLLRPTTRLVGLNFPNNPTGANATPETFSEIINICRARGIYVLNDEVYRGVESDERKRLSHIADLYERGLSLNVTSKAYGFPGLRVGWIACKDRELLKRMLRLKHYLSVCNNVLGEILATIVLKNSEQILSRNRALVRENLTILRSFFARHSKLFEWYEPDGGCVFFPRYLGGDVERLCESLIRDAGIFTLPSSTYRSDLAPTPADRFRVGFGRRGLETILTALDTFLQGYRAA